MRQPPDSVSVRPLGGRGGLRRGDLRTLLRAGFWPAASTENDLDGEAVAAALSLMAIAGIPDRPLSSIELAAAMPDVAPNSIGIPIADRVEIVRLPPVVVLLLEAWKKKREAKETTSTKLLVTATGEEMDARALLRHLQQAAAGLGLDGSLNDHARDFFIDNFYRHPDYSRQDAAKLERHLKRFDGHCPAQQIPAAEKRLVRKRADPFPDADKSFIDDERALEDARRMRTKLPRSWEKCFRARVDRTPQRLGDDHPLVVELANTVLSRHNTTRGAQIFAIYLAHRTELDRLAESGSLPRRAAADVFGLSRAQYMRMVAEAKRQAGELPPKPGRRQPRARPALTINEAERVHRIEALAIPGEVDMDDFRRRLWRRQGPFVFGLSRDGKISVEDGAALLRTHKLDFVRMKLDHEAGVFGHWLRPRPTIKEARKWTVFVREHLHERAEGQGDTDFIRALRRHHDLPVHESVAVRAIRAPVRSRSAKPAYRKAPPVPLSDAERARLEELFAREKPVGPFAHKEQIARLKTDGPFVFDLVRARRLDLKDAAAALRISIRRSGELHTLHLEGDLHLALKINTRAESRQARELLVAELERRGAERGIAALCRDIRRRHRIYISRSAACTILRQFERERGRKPNGHPMGAFDRTPDPRLTHTEKARLKAIDGLGWNTAADVADLRRSVFATDGDFLMDLIALRKIECADGARLTRLPGSMFSAVRRDFAVGQRSRHCEPPPEGAERRRQEDEVVRQAAASDPNERYVDFTAKLPVDITLSHGRIRVLRRAALEARGMTADDAPPRVEPGPVTVAPLAAAEPEITPVTVPTDVPLLCESEPCQLELFDLAH